MYSSNKFETLVIPALGRPFALGLLYNANRDDLIPALSLWDIESLSKNVTEREQFSLDSDVRTLDTLNEKTEGLNVNNRLKIGILADTVSVGGSAKFLRDNKTSQQQENITLQIKQTQIHRELTTDILCPRKTEDWKSSQVFELARAAGATHVVVGITYGSQVNMVFGGNFVNENEKTEFGGRLRTKLRAVADVLCNLSLTLEARCEKASKVDTSEINVKIYGDISLEGKCPVTFQQAVELYQSLPEMMRNKTVPVTVYLLPLSAFDEQIPKWEIHVCDDDVQAVEDVFQELWEAETLFYDLCNSPAFNTVPKLKKKPQQIASLIKRYRNKLQTRLRECQDFEEDDAIGNLVDEHFGSPFTARLLNKLLDETEIEISYIEMVIQTVEPAPTVSRMIEIQRHLHSKEHVIGLEVVLYIEKVPFMDEMKDYIRTCKPEKKYEFVPTGEYTKPEIRELMQRRLKELTSLTKRNQEKEECSTLCCIQGIEDTSELHKFGNPQLMKYEGDYSLSKPYDPYDGSRKSQAVPPKVKVSPAPASPKRTVNSTQPGTRNKSPVEVP